MNTEIELTKAQIERQDFVDNTISDFLTKISEGLIDSWSIYDIGLIRDTVENILVRDYKLITSQEFYPYINH